MNAHAEAWRALETEVEVQIGDLERAFGDAAQALGRYAACVREPDDTLTVARVAEYATRLAGIQARLAERRELLARMRSTIEFAGKGS